MSLSANETALKRKFFDLSPYGSSSSSSASNFQLSPSRKKEVSLNVYNFHMHRICWCRKGGTFYIFDEVVLQWKFFNISTVKCEICSLVSIFGAIASFNISIWVLIGFSGRRIQTLSALFFLSSNSYLGPLFVRHCPSENRIHIWAIL